MQRVPAVMDLYILVDMGRMAPQWLWAEGVAVRRFGSRRTVRGAGHRSGSR
jgi:hypothetical protein